MRHVLSAKRCAALAPAARWGGEQRRCAFEHGLSHVLGRRIEATTQQLGKVAVQRTHGRADAHVVVVQDDQQVAVRDARVVQGFKGHAGGHGTVANDGNGMPVYTLDAGSLCHAQRGRNGRAGVRCAEGVEFAFATLRETGEATQLAKGWHAVTPPGENFVRVSLVPYVPHDPVVGGVEHIVQGHSQLHGAQVGTEVSAGLGHTLQQKGPQLVGQLSQLITRYLAEVCGALNGVQQGELVFWHMLLFQELLAQ